MSRRSKFASASTSGLLGVNISTYREDSRSREKKKNSSGKKASAKPSTRKANVSVYEAPINLEPSYRIYEALKSSGPNADHQDWIDEGVEEVALQHSANPKKVRFEADLTYRIRKANSIVLTRALISTSDSGWAHMLRLIYQSYSVATLHRNTPAWVVKTPPRTFIDATHASIHLLGAETAL